MPLHDPSRRPGGVEAVEGVEDRGTGAAQESAGLDEQRTGTLASGGDGGRAAGRAAADHEHVPGPQLVEAADVVGGVAHSDRHPMLQPASTGRVTPVVPAAPGDISQTTAEAIARAGSIRPPSGWRSASRRPM
jgi:hypothetical protein